MFFTNCNICIYIFLFHQGVHDESEVYKNCNSKLGYLNKAIHLIKRLRGNNVDIMKVSNTDNQLITNKIPAPFPETRKLEHLLTGL